MNKKTFAGLAAAAPLAAMVIVGATRPVEAVVVDGPAGTGLVSEGGMPLPSRVALALATVKITVDFGNTSVIEESSGAEFTATPAANLTDAQKTAIMNKISEKYEAVLGAGNVTVVEEAIGNGVGTGDYGVVISGGKGPGTKYGNAGAGTGKPAIVYLGIYKNLGYSGDGLTNAVGETSAHEVAHRIGVGHNGDKSRLMTSGRNVSKAQREADERPFSADDAEAIEENLGTNTEPRESDTTNDLISQCGSFPDANQDPDFIPDDHIMSAVIWYEGTAGLEFGYINVLDEFVYQGNAMLPGDPEVDEFADVMPFVHTGEWHEHWVLALRDGADVFPFDVYGLGSPILSVPNPLQPDVFLVAELQFDLVGNLLVDNTIFLDAAITGPHSGGFLMPPRPCPCDCEATPDGTVDAGDFFALLGQWGNPGPCDCEATPDGAVDAGDFFALLAAWGHCPELVPAGIDCWETRCDRTKASFCEQPLPANFFEPGSEPFDGVVALQGATGGVDTQVARLQDMVFDRVPQSETIDIEIVALNLVSCQPIEVDCGGTPCYWDVQVDLSEIHPPPGQMVVTKTHENGGVFTSDFPVQPRFTFINVDDPTDIRVLDTGLEGLSPDHLYSVGEMPWVHELEPDSPIEPCGINFVPGVEEQPPGAPQWCRPVRHTGVMVDHIVVADLACPMYPLGACCLADGSCVPVAGEAFCVIDLSGEYKGDGTTCAGDADADGIADVRENNHCCGPTDPCNTGTSPVNPDTDGDGILDGVDPAPCEAIGS